MAIFALWSAPRARSTAFFRSMAERGDLTVLHEPFCNLLDYGETDAGGRTFGSPAPLLAWLHDQAHRRDVFLKDTMDHQHDEVLAGMDRLCQLQTAIAAAGGTPPVVIDSDDLVTRPAATLAAYCAAVGLPFNPRALTWERGEQPEWRRTALWHTDASNSTGFERHEREYPHTVENSGKLARYAARHRPFYEQLYAQRMDVSPWERTAGS